MARRFSDSVRRSVSSSTLRIARVATVASSINSSRLALESSSCVTPFFLLHSMTNAKRNAIQNETKTLVGEFLCLLTRRKEKSTAFQFLGEERKARSIPSQNLRVVASSVDEDEEAARMRILFWEDALYQGEESLETFSHIRRLRVGEDALEFFMPSHTSTLPAQSGAAGKHELEGSLRRRHRRVR